MALSAKVTRHFRCFIRRNYQGVKYASTAENLHLTRPHINLDKNVEEWLKRKESVQLRKLTVDTIKLKSLYEFWKYLQTTKLQLEKRKMEITDHRRDLKKIENDKEVTEEMEKLTNEFKIIKEDLSTLMKTFVEVQETVTDIVLSLPNDLHRDTPEQEDKTVHQFLDRPHINQMHSHLEIAKNLDLIEYKDPSCVYLKSTAAVFELACLYYFGQGLKPKKYIQFSNPDFARTVLIDTLNIDPSDANSVFVIRGKDKDKVSADYRLHLVGGASVFPFCAFHARRKINHFSLPLKYYSLGRQYRPTPESSEDGSGLFGTWQSTVVEVFALTADDEDEMTTVFQSILDDIVNLYEELGYHFRVVYPKAGALHSWESLRASIQMYSCHKQKYIEVGKLSMSGNYISERLLMGYTMSEDSGEPKFMNVISGTAVDVPKLLGCIVEQMHKNDEKLVIPNCLKPHCFGI